MLRELAQGARTVGQLAAPFAISLAAASKHIKVLEQAGLLRREVRGRTHLCHLAPGPLASAHQWLSFYARFWTDRLDVLERLLRTEDAGPSPTHTGYSREVDRSTSRCSRTGHDGFLSPRSSVA
jgi:DNA-binding transcriptional ArsR family regulator